MLRYAGYRIGATNFPYRSMLHSGGPGAVLSRGPKLVKPLGARRGATMKRPSKTVENPFRSKGEMGPESFCGREELEEDLFRALKGGASVALAASRRTGKTWLAKSVLRRLEKAGLLTAYLDMVYIHSPARWIEGFASAVLSAISAGPKELFRVTRDYLPALGMDSVTASPSGYRLRLRGRADEAALQAVAEQVYRLPEVLARATKKRFVVCLDEYPEIVSFIGPKVLVRWKRQLRESKAVSYLLASARPRLIRDIFEAPRAPMAGLVRTFRLEKIPAARWADFIADRFRRTGFAAPRPVIEELVRATHGYSYYTQLACRHLWNRRKETRRLEAGDALGLVDWILDQEDPYFEQTWRGLTKPRQTFLAAVAADPGRQIFSADFRLAHRLPPASTLQAVVKFLEEEGLIERSVSGCAVVDPFFQEWLKRRVA